MTDVKEIMAQKELFFETKESYAEIVEDYVFEEFGGPDSNEIVFTHKNVVISNMHAAELTDFMPGWSDQFEQMWNELGDSMPNMVEIDGKQYSIAGYFRREANTAILVSAGAKDDVYIVWSVYESDNSGKEYWKDKCFDDEDEAIVYAKEK